MSGALSDGGPVPGAMPAGPVPDATQLQAAPRFAALGAPYVVPVQFSMPRWPLTSVWHRNGPEPRRRAKLGLRGARHRL